MESLFLQVTDKAFLVNILLSLSCWELFFLSVIASGKPTLLLPRSVLHCFFYNLGRTIGFSGKKTNGACSINNFNFTYNSKSMESDHMVSQVFFCGMKSTHSETFTLNFADHYNRLGELLKKYTCLSLLPLSWRLGAVRSPPGDSVSWLENCWCTPFFWGGLWTDGSPG